MTETIDPLGAVTTFTYDALGQVISETDPVGRPTTFSYDAEGDLISVMDPTGGLTTYAYAVPEPAAWAIMALGFGATGLALRRRKRVLAAL